MLKVSEIKTVLTHIIKNNQYLESQGKKKNSLLVEGEAGLGKTSIIQQVARENGMDFVKISLSQIEQCGEISGWPYMERQTEDGRWLSDKELEFIEGEICFTGETRTSYAQPAWVPRDDRGVVLLLDDFTRAPTHIMQAVMEIIDRGEYISWKLPKNCHIILTSNPQESGEYIVTNLDEAQKTRYIRLIMKYDVNEWAQWAEMEGVDSRCINFLLLNPEMIKKNTNPRLATDYFNAISSIQDFNSAHALQMINWLGDGSVGPEFSTVFALFINNKLDKVPSPKEIMETDTDVGAINKIKAAVGAVDTATYKQNIASVISTRLLNYMNKIIEDKSFKKKETVNRIAEIIKSGAFSGDINYNFVKTLNMKKQFAPLIEDKEIVKIVTR
jgi:hypothetical protein